METREDHYADEYRRRTANSHRKHPRKRDHDKGVQTEEATLGLKDGRGNISEKSSLGNRGAKVIGGNTHNETGAPRRGNFGKENRS